MTDRRDYGPITDADLVAYIDGLLDDDSTKYVERELAKNRELEQRLALLKAGDRPFEEAFDLLLDQAPAKRLEETLEKTLNPPAPVSAPRDDVAVHPAARRREPWAGWRMLAAAAVLLAVFCAGLFTSRLVPSLGPQVASLPAAKGWRAAVAEYQSLFVKATLENTGHDWGDQVANLKRALTHVGVDLDVAKVTVDPLKFKYAGILEFKGKPLIQLAYLYKDQTPVSLCIIKNGQPAHGLKSEQRLGLNISFWQTDGYGYMVIGDVSADAVTEIARTLKAQLI